LLSRGKATFESAMRTAGRIAIRAHLRRFSRSNPIELHLSPKFLTVRFLMNPDFPISWSGNKKFWGELINYPLLISDVPSLNLQHNMKSWGILDIQRMEWIVKPQGLKLWEVDYSYRGDCGLIQASMKSSTTSSSFMRAKAPIMLTGN
jgi:hypothetical protein